MKLKVGIKTHELDIVLVHVYRRWVHSAVEDLEVNMWNI